MAPSCATPAPAVLNHGRWQVLGHPDASLERITPSGYRYASHPHDYRPHPAERRPGLPDDQPPERAEGRPPDPTRTR